MSMSDDNIAPIGPIDKEKDPFVWNERAIRTLAGLLFVF